ncbi:MAG: hypothetical protein CL791_01520 [Chloroflexi bacterium]|nr:hypothetical protein [Chloroflexota bacterium]
MKTVFQTKIVRYVALPLIVTLSLIILGGGWYFSDVLEKDGLTIDNEPGDFLVKITEVNEDAITVQQIKGVETEENLRISALWGISNDESYGQLGEIILVNKDSVIREFKILEGEFNPGDHARLDRTAYPHDPYSAHKLDYSEIMIDAPLGEIGAWIVEADSDNWAILVHGRTDNKDSSLKIIDDLHDLNVNSMTIDYRNDDNAPPSKSGYYEFGTTEWEDLEAAVQYAITAGAKTIFLVGYSMGGGIVVNYQLRSNLSQHTTAIILEAPMLHFGRTIDKGAEERSVPAPITYAAKMLASVRFGVNWNAMDYLSNANEIDVPVLLIHGEADDTVPVETSIEFANTIPHLVELHTYAEVGHVSVWNWYPDEYTKLIKEFIESFR